ncbi:MAG TPA: hypothetical protein VGG14_11485 [Candidatus Sulfotelmatobacter sp.]|jgi:hypothetical protein
MSYRETGGTAAVISSLLVSLLLVAQQSAYSATAAPPVPASLPDYLSALSAADHFLQAWQAGDTENGMSLLTSHAKKAVTTEIVEEFFSNEPPAAYEIEHGKVLSRGRYEFPVVLMTAKHNRIHRQFSSIIVLDTGGNDWAIDKLP